MACEAVYCERQNAYIQQRDGQALKCGGDVFVLYLALTLCDDKHRNNISNAAAERKAHRLQQREALRCRNEQNSEDAAVERRHRKYREAVSAFALEHHSDEKQHYQKRNAHAATYSA